MDQVKIGKFIAECRKKNNLTQLRLAEKLGITDRAVSKWETGKTMPDSSIMLALCDTLQITVNDLLNGEAVSEENYTKKLEERVVELEYMGFEWYQTNENQWDHQWCVVYNVDGQTAFADSSAYGITGSGAN